MKKMKTLLLSALLTILSIQLTFAQRPFFNKSKDILIAQFDSKPDPDDIHAQAALGCMLAHPDLDGVNYYAVAGAIGIQNGIFIDSDALFDMAFGSTNWTDADANWSASVTAITNKVLPVLQNGGQVWVQEAGQSNITADWVAEILKTIPAATVKTNVIVVQHSQWNEDQTASADLTYVKNKTWYFALDDGNAPDGASWGDRGPWSTPEYRSKDASWMAQAKSSVNPKAKQLWTEADRIIDTMWPNGYPHDWSYIHFDGVDYSDCVENWWILNIGVNADNNTKFWNRYVTNTPSNAVNVTGVSLSPASASITAGGGTNLTATVSPSNATNKNVSWVSSNTNVASVNSSGVVSGIAAGTATITATTQDGGFTAATQITVVPSTGGTGAWQEANGYLVIDTESLELTSNLWSKHTTGGTDPWGNGYIQYDGPNRLGGAIADAHLKYNIKISTPGTYQFIWRTGYGFNSQSFDGANDSWLKINGSEFYGMKNGTRVDSKDHFMKLWVQKDAFVNECYGEHNGQNGLTIFADFDAPGYYSIEISGRSQGHVIDRMFLFQEGNRTVAMTKTTPESIRESGSIPVVQAPYGGTNRSIPGTIQAEEFDTGGQGLAYNDADVTNNGANIMREDEGVDIEARDGGNAVGWTADGEWLEYTVNTTGGTYDLQARLASTQVGKKVNVLIDGTQIASFNVPNTGDWGVFQTVTIPNISLASGSNRILRLEFEGGATNINWVKFNTVTVIVPVTSVSVAPASLSLEIGQTETLTTAVLPSNASDKSVTWSSSNTSIATVNGSGVVTAIAAGSATITATSVDGPTGSASVIVTAPIAGNLIQNAGFETGDLTSWNSWGGVSVVANNQRTGGYAVTVNGTGAPSQVVSVSPNTTYTYSIWGKVAANGQLAYVGVKNHDAPESSTQLTATSYSEVTHTFTTGPNATTAQIYFYCPNAAYQVWADDAVLVEGGTSTPPTTIPTTVTLSPIQDTYLQGTNNLNQSIIRIEAGNRVGYLMYDLSGVNGTITEAALKMACNGDAGNGNININAGTSNAWTETTLSNANKPVAGALLGNLNSTYAVGTTYTWSLDASALNGGGNLSLVVTQTGGNDVAFASKENAAGGPQLVITYDAPVNNRLEANKALWINDGIASQSISVYPNPVAANGIINIALGAQGIEKIITIFDEMGRTVYQINTANAQLKLPLNQLVDTKGVYLMKVQTQKTNGQIVKLMVR